MSKGFRRPSKTPIGEVTQLIDIRTIYPKKDIPLLLHWHRILRPPSTDEIFEQVLGETNILDRLSNKFGNQFPKGEQYACPDSGSN